MQTRPVDEEQQKRNMQDPEIQALVNVLKSDEMKDWITEKYEGSVLPVA